MEIDGDGHEMHCALHCRWGWTNENFRLAEHLVIFLAGFFANQFVAGK